MSDLRLISAANPSRTTGWSSAINTVYTLRRDSDSRTVSLTIILVVCILISRSVACTALWGYVTKTRSQSGKLIGEVRTIASAAMQMFGVTRDDVLFFVI